ncbi:MAG TPA: hypothetical protein VFI48_01155, partial [Hyphomicrobiaceae bacterium]|nr:hypothetical protein [Hyphomicrobiaceae bacterium]
MARSPADAIRAWLPKTDARCHCAQKGLPEEAGTADNTATGVVQRGAHMIHLVHRCGIAGLACAVAVLA